TLRAILYLYTVTLSHMSQPVPVSISPLILPLAEATVRAGFPSPAADFSVRRLDLNDILITHPQATFLLRVRGDSMRDIGIDDGDTLVVDRALTPQHGSIVVAVLDGEFTVKQLYKRAGRFKLKAGNPTYPDIIPTADQ